MRDRYFSYNPWGGKEAFRSGLPDDITDETRDYLGRVWDGYKSFTHCTLAELRNESLIVFDEWNKLQRREDVIAFASNFARHLGYGKDKYYEDDDEERENILLLYRNMEKFIGGVYAMVSLVTNNYCMDYENIRVILWTA